MSNITYIQGDLFELAPINSNLAQACNCQGVWGSGIAVQFRKRFPKSYKNYVDYCILNGYTIVGTALVHDRTISLMTSLDYGKNKDTPDQIIINTRKAISDLIISYPSISEIHMPKINAGLFAVLWYDTEMVLKEFDGLLNFVVYELEK